jgi:hypothetical protein
VGENQACRVKKRALEVRHGTNMSRQMTPNTAVRPVAHNRVANGAQMNPDLMSAACGDGDVQQ